VYSFRGWVTVVVVVVVVVVPAVEEVANDIRCGGMWAW